MDTKSGILIVLSLVIVGGLVYMGYKAWPPVASTAPAQSEATLQVVDTVVGTGVEAVPGDSVSVHYTGTLTDGTKFDSSLDRGAPFEFVVGSGMVIQGWEQGIPGMKVGGKRHLVIPPSMGYGAQQMGSIPANSTLVFDVELMGVKKAAKASSVPASK